MSVQDLLEYLVRYPRDAEVLVQADPFSPEIELDSVYTNAAWIMDPADPRMPPFAAIGLDHNTVTRVYLQGAEAV